MTFPFNALRLPLLLALSLISTAVFAQRPQLFMNTDTVSVGEEVSLEIRGINVSEAVSISYSIIWDSTKLDYIESELDLDELMIGEADVDTGLVRVIYLGDGISPLGYADSSVIAQFRFAPKMGVEGNVDVRFIGAIREDPRARADTTVVVGAATVPATWIDGGFFFETGVSVSTFTNDPRLRVNPNPVTVNSQVEINLNYQTDAVLEVLDANGRQMSARRIRILPGLQQERFGLGDFPQAGTYVIRLTTDREQFTRKVIRQ